MGPVGPHFENGVKIFKIGFLNLALPAIRPIFVMAGSMEMLSDALVWFSCPKEMVRDILGGSVYTRLVLCKWRQQKWMGSQGALSHQLPSPLRIKNTYGWMECQRTSNSSSLLALRSSYMSTMMTIKAVLQKIPHWVRVVCFYYFIGPSVGTIILILQIMIEAVILYVVIPFY